MVRPRRDCGGLLLYRVGANAVAFGQPDTLFGFILYRLPCSSGGWKSPGGITRPRREFRQLPLERRPSFRWGSLRILADLEVLDPDRREQPARISAGYMALVVVAVVASNARGGCARSSRIILVWLGAVSYSLYLAARARRSI